MTLDRIDKSILRQLQTDNHISNLILAEKVGLSPPACLKRVKRLRDQGVIVADVSILSPKALGNRIDVIFLVEMKNDAMDTYQIFSDSVQKQSEITQCYQVAGDSDFVLVGSVESIEALDTLSNRLFRNNKNIKRFKTLISKRRSKFTTAIDF